MSKERYEELFIYAYENYCEWVNSENKKGIDHANALRKKGILVKQYYVSKVTQEEFINRCKTDDEFAKNWGLTIEERKLSYLERYDIHKNYMPVNRLYLFFELATNENLDKFGVPTKLITITYNDKKIEIYE